LALRQLCLQLRQIFERHELSLGQKLHVGEWQGCGPAELEEGIVIQGIELGLVDAIRATADDTAEDIAEMEADEAMTRRVLDLLGSKRNDAYEAALSALRGDTQAWWADVLARDAKELEEDEELATADVEGLSGFLEAEVLPWFENRKNELANRPLIREQAIGEALDPDRLEGLARYEVHLDRKLERMLAMLLRLKDLRQGTVEA